MRRARLSVLAGADADNGRRPCDTMSRKIPCQPGRKPKNIEESKREEEIPPTESNVELRISELDPFTTPLRLNRTFI